MKALRKGTKTPIIAVINAGSAVDVSAIADYADAIILAWYPGEERRQRACGYIIREKFPLRSFARDFLQRLQRSAAL